MDDVDVDEDAVDVEEETRVWVTVLQIESEL